MESTKVQTLTTIEMPAFCDFLCQEHCGSQC